MKVINLNNVFVDERKSFSFFMLEKLHPYYESRVAS